MGTTINNDVNPFGYFHELVYGDSDCCGASTSIENDTCTKRVTIDIESYKSNIELNVENENLKNFNSVVMNDNRHLHEYVDKLKSEINYLNDKVKSLEDKLMNSCSNNNLNLHT